MDVQSSRAKGKVHIGGDWKVGRSRNGAGKDSCNMSRVRGPGQLSSSGLKSLSCVVLCYVAVYFLLHVIFGWVPLLFSSSMIWGLTCPGAYEKGPILLLMVPCSDNSIWNMEPSGRCYGSRSSYFWDAFSLACVSSLFRVVTMLYDRWLCMPGTRSV